MEPRFVIAGLAVGFLIGISGVGSGSLMAPLLLLLGIQPATVVGSDLGFGLLTKSAGVGLHIRQRLVRWRWVWLMGVGSFPGALVGSYLVARISHSGSTIRSWIAVLLVVTSLAVMLLELARQRGAAWIAPLQKPRTWLVALLGFLIGVAVGATSVGSGSLIDLALILFSPLSGAEIVGTGIAHAILLSTVASLAHWSFGTIDSALVRNLLVGSIPGVLLGGRLAYRCSSRALRLGIAALVLLLGLTMITGSIRS
jgi:uncharacterized membrane protein YfcA